MVVPVRGLDLEAEGDLLLEDDGLDRAHVLELHLALQLAILCC